MRSLAQQFKQSKDRTIARWLFAISLAGLLLLFPIVWKNHIPGGDEPINLALAHSISQNRTFDLTRFLEERQWREDRFKNTFDITLESWELSPAAPQARAGTNYSIHNIGFPLLIAPIYAMGGRLPVMILLNILAALLTVNLYYLARRVTEDKLLAAVLALSFSFTLPLLLYSYVIFTDLFAALLIAYAFRFQRGWLTILAVAYLPWIKVKYYLQTLILSVLLAIRLAAPKTVAILVGGSLLLLAMFANQVYGSPSPLIIATASGRFGLPDGLYGLLIDVKTGLITWSPYFILLIPAVTVFFLRHRPLFWTWFLVVAPYFLIVGLYDHWHGDHSPPPRQLVAILPLFILPLASLLDDKTHRRWAQSLYGFLLVPSVLISAHALRHPVQVSVHRYISEPDNLEWLIRLGVPNFNLESIFPTAGISSPQLIIWLAVLVVLLVAPIWARKN